MTADRRGEGADRSRVATAARVFLWFGALVMLGVGALFYVRPETLESGMGVMLPTPKARIDAQATYGGIEFGVGLFLAWSALRRQRFGAGLVGAACVSLGAGVARGAGMLQAWHFDVRHALFGGLELVLGLVAVGLAWALRHDGRVSSS